MIDKGSFDVDGYGSQCMIAGTVKYVALNLPSLGNIHRHRGSAVPHDLGGKAATLIFPPHKASGVGTQTGDHQHFREYLAIFLLLLNTFEMQDTTLSTPVHY